MKLLDLGVSVNFVNVLELLYSNTSVKVWDGSDLSESFETMYGVKQGCNLSPLLFALYINDVVEYVTGGINFAGINIKVLLFADDIVLISNTPEKLQRMINKFHEYCKLWNLIINREKTKVIFDGGSWTGKKLKLSKNINI